MDDFLLVAQKKYKEDREHIESKKQVSLTLFWWFVTFNTNMTRKVAKRNYAQKEIKFKNLNLRFLNVLQDLSQEGDLQKVMER